jgi:hypothetical protein
MAKFDALEKNLKAKLAQKAELTAMWKKLDFNGNNMCSLAEIDKWVVENPELAILNHKPALMRAYQLTIKKSKKEQKRDADFVHKPEFPGLIRNLFYFNKLFQLFEDMCNNPAERRIDLANFKAHAKSMGIANTDAEAEADFKDIDKNGGGEILFDEFCAWVIEKQVPGVDNFDDI